MQKRFLLGLALLSLGILIFVCACQHGAPKIQTDLQERARSALAGMEGGTQDLELAVDGRNLRLNGSVQDEDTRQRVLEAVEGLRGLRTIDDRLSIASSSRDTGATSRVADGAEGTSSVTDSPAGLGDASSTATGASTSGASFTGVSIAARDDGRWLLQGRLTDPAQRRAWLDAAHTMFGADLVIDQLELSSDRASSGDTGVEVTPAQGSATISPVAWVTALSAGPSDAGLYLGDRSVRVEGSVPDEPSAQRFLAAVGRAVPEDWQIVDALARTGAADKAAVQEALIAALQLRNIEFETNRSSITPAGRQIVLRVAQALRAAPQLAVAIEGHTDSSGDAEWNQTLSQERAEAVAEALQALGIDPSRLSARGFGSSRPIADNSTREGRQNNRRIEFNVLGGTQP